LWRRVRLPLISDHREGGAWAATVGSGAGDASRGGAARGRGDTESWRWRGSTVTRARGSPRHTTRPTSTSAAQRGLESGGGSGRERRRGWSRPTTKGTAGRRRARSADPISTYFGLFLLTQHYLFYQSSSIHPTSRKVSE
jgi:hypothetical protein